MKSLVLPALSLVLAGALACVSAPETLDPEPVAHVATRGGPMPSPQSPAGLTVGPPGALSTVPVGTSVTFQARGPFRVDLARLPTSPPAEPPAPRVAPPPGRMLSAEDMERLRSESWALPPDGDVSVLPQGPASLAPLPGTGFPAIDFVGAASGLTPPDPELAVGTTHMIAVVNSAFEIYDKTGTSVVGPIGFAAFLAPLGGSCTVFPFDPVVLYDEQADRFMVGVDGNGTDFCMGVSANPGDILNWNLYTFPTLFAGDTLFDYPHVGVGWNAIYLGSNNFGAAFHGQVWALDKNAAYVGAAMLVVTQSTGADSTPWPANFHGAVDGSFPNGGPHWIMTEVYDGCNHNVWTWTDPFGMNTFTRGANLDLCAATGVPPALPIPGQQLAGMDIYDIVDWRGQSTEYRNGTLWMTNQGLACNPGGGTVDCIRWAQIDPVANAILDAGVFASPGDYRAYPSLVANRCNDMAIGYTVTSQGIWPETRVTGREAADPPGSVQPEALLKLGEQTYSCFDTPPPLRWGDYTGMTIDPDGVRFWYLGEYSKTMPGPPACDWGTFIGSFTFRCPIFADGFESGNTLAWANGTP